MRGIKAFFLALGCLSLVGLDAAPSVWTPASDALPDTILRFTETSLGRFETVAVGSFPIMLFYVGFGFDMATYANSGFQRAYAPWPFKSVNAPAPSQSELVQRLLSAVGLSFGVATLDAILKPFAVERKKRESPESYFPKPSASLSTDSHDSQSAESTLGVPGDAPSSGKPASASAGASAPRLFPAPREAR